MGPRRSAAIFLLGLVAFGCMSMVLEPTHDKQVGGFRFNALSTQPVRVDQLIVLVDVNAHGKAFARSIRTI